MADQSRTLPDGTKIWTRDGTLHRDDGPARVRPDGERAWYRNGLLHREDGPAKEYPEGTRAWYRRGDLQRVEARASSRESAGEARRVRFHPPQPSASPDARARIPFDVGGLPAGELREIPNTGGSGWIVSSLDADLQGVTIGREEAFGLGRICREVERAAAAGAGGDGWLAREEERRRLAQEAPPASPVRFRPPGEQSMGYAGIGVEVDGRLVGHLRELPADQRADGTQWVMYSRHPELDRIGTGPPFGLGKACREVADVAEHCRDRLSEEPRPGPEMDRCPW